MSDLISRKALIEDIHRLKQQVFLSEEAGHNRPFSDKANIIDCINAQPIAYDVNKVVEQMEGLKHPYITFPEGYGNLNAFDYYIVKAKELMKGGDQS